MPNPYTPKFIAKFLGKARQKTVHAETVGNAGLIETRKCRRTGTLVSLYRADEAGMENDPTLPYATVCEVHSNLVCHETQALGRQWLAEPDGWCEECRLVVAAKENKNG